MSRSCFFYDAHGGDRGAIVFDANFDIFAPQLRYTPKIKFALVEATRRGVISAERAREIHGVCEEEWAAWQKGASLGRSCSKGWKRLRITRRVA